MGMYAERDQQEDKTRDYYGWPGQLQSHAVTAKLSVPE